LRPLLAELDRIGWVTRMDLGRLNRQDTGQLAAQITGRKPGDDLLAAVYRRSQGNPLFVEALFGEGEPGVGLPESLRDLLVAAMRRLPEQTQEVVRVASAGGERTGHELLAAVTGLDGAALARALRPVVAANVLLTDPDGYVFRHALIREAVHDELLPGERGQLHRRFAEAIAAGPGLVMPGRAAAEQAWHWYAAHDTSRALAATEPGEPPPPGDMRAAWDKAAKAWAAVGEPYPLAVALLRSAEAALAAGDRDDGATQLRRAAELAQRLGAGPLREDIVMLAMRARITLGRPGEAAGAQTAPGRAGQAQGPEPERLGLTARELEVLRLVAAGRSNREIAGELLISVKTASVHVSNILGKLGVTSRGEAAATRLRLFDSFPP